MAKATIGTPIFSITPGERLEMEQKARQIPVVDMDVQDILNGPGGDFVVSARNSTTGALAWRLGMPLANLFEDDTSDPLNLIKLKSEFDPAKDPLSFSLENNPDAIAKDLRGVPFEEWSYILAAPSYNQYKQRLGFIKAGLPEAQEASGSLGAFVGGAADLGAMMALGVAAEPLALAGLGARGALAGRAVSFSAGTWRMQGPAEAALEAAALVSRKNLTARFAALGVAEQAVWSAARNGLDPLYDPSVSEVVWDLTVAGGISGILGGAVLGRRFVQEHIDDAAREFRATKTVDLPGGYTITYSDRLRFDSPAAADRMLFAPGTKSLKEDVESIAKELFEDWQKSKRIAEFSIPKVPGVRSAIKAAAFEIELAGGSLTEKVFADVTESLIRAEATKLTAGGFNKVFWEEVSKRLDPETAARLRPSKERAFIGGIDRTVMDPVARENMVDAVWDAFKAGRHTDPANEKSLIFQALQEIKNRNGTVNRKVIGEVIDELRIISQNPPTRINAKGRKVLDLNARRLAVAQVINKRAKGGKEIPLPASLLNKMKVVSGARGGAVAAGKAGVSGLVPQEDFANVPKVQAWFERIPIWEKWGNQSARLMQSDNGAARLIGWLSFGARRSFEIAQPQTIFEAGTSAMHGMMFSFLKGYRNGYVRFALGNGSQNIVKDADFADLLKTAFGRRELKRDFNRRVAKQLRSGNYDDGVDAVNETAKGMRDIFNKIHDMASSVGLRGFDRSAAVNYFPRLWRFDKIRRLATTEEGKKDLIALIKQSMGKDGRKVIIDGKEEIIKGDLDQAATAFANRLIAIARGTENAPLIQQEQELFDALQGISGPIKAKTPSKTPFGRARVILDESVVMQTAADHLGDGKMVLSLDELFNDDLPFVFRKYVTSVMGAVNEKRLLNAFNDELRARGVFSPKYVAPTGEVLQNEIEVTTIDEMLGLAKKIGGDIDPGHEEGFREIMAAIRYEPIHHGVAGIGDKILGLALPYGYLVTGGQFGLAALGEVSRTIGTLGFRTTVTQMPILNEMITNYKNLDKEAQNMSSLLDAWFNPSTDRLRRVFVDPMGGTSQYSEVGGLERSYGVFKRALDGAANVASDITLLAPVTSFTQQLAAATTLQHLYDVGKGFASRMDNATIRALGLEPEQYEQIIKYVSSNAKTEAGFLGDRIVGMDNLDAKEMDLVKAFVDRLVRSRVQDMPTRGDFHKLAFSFVGRLLTQFRTFNLKGIDNFLIQNASRVGRGGGAKVASEVAATLMLAGTIQYLRNYAKWRSSKAAGRREEAEEIEKTTLTMNGAIRGALSGPSEMWLIGMGVDAAWSLYDQDPLFSPYRYSGLSWYGFPGEAMVSRMGTVAKDAYGSTVGKEFDLSVKRDITRGTVHKARLIAPLQNAPGISHFYNLAEEAIAEEWNLQRTQPRRSRD